MQETVIHITLRMQPVLQNQAGCSHKCKGRQVWKCISFSEWKWSFRLPVCSGTRSLNFRLACHVVDTNTTHPRNLLPVESSALHLHSAPHALSFSKQAKMMNRCADVKQQGEPSPTKEYTKRTFIQYSWQQLVWDLQELLLIPTLENVTISASPNRWFCLLGTQGSSPCLQERLISPTKWNCFISPYRGRLPLGRPSWRSRARDAFQSLAALQACALGETCTYWLKRNCGALRSAPQVGPWRGRIHGKQGLPRLHSPSIVFWIRNLKFSGFCPVREYFSGLDSVGLWMDETSFFFFFIPSFIFSWVWKLGTFLNTWKCCRTRKWFPTSSD